MFSSFTEKREEAEEYGRAWRGGIPVLFVLRSAWCRRTKNGTYLHHPFAVLQVEAVVGNAVRLVEVELPEPGLVAPLPGRRPGVVPTVGKRTELHEAARCGDVRAFARLATRPELINGLDPSMWTPLAVATMYGKTEAVKTLVWLGVDMTTPAERGATPDYNASQDGRESTIQVLASLGADVNLPCDDGAAPIHVASQGGHESAVRALASLGAEVGARCKNGRTPVYIASERGHESVVRAFGVVGSGRKRVVQGRSDADLQRVA
jgi:hypothetical protein